MCSVEVTYLLPVCVILAWLEVRVFQLVKVSVYLSHILYVHGPTVQQRMSK